MLVDSTGEETSADRVAGWTGGVVLAVEVVLVTGAGAASIVNWGLAFPESPKTSKNAS